MPPLIATSRLGTFGPISSSAEGFSNRVWRSAASASRLRGLSRQGRGFGAVTGELGRAALHAGGVARRLRRSQQTLGVVPIRLDLAGAPPQRGRVRAQVARPRRQLALDGHKIGGEIVCGRRDRDVAGGAARRGDAAARRRAMIDVPSPLKYRSASSERRSGALMVWPISDGSATTRSRNRSAAPDDTSPSSSRRPARSVTSGNICAQARRGPAPSNRRRESRRDRACLADRFRSARPSTSSTSWY